MPSNVAPICFLTTFITRFLGTVRESVLLTAATPRVLYGKRRVGKGEPQSLAMLKNGATSKTALPSYLVDWRHVTNSCIPYRGYHQTSYEYHNTQPTLYLVLTTSVTQKNFLCS